MAEALELQRAFLDAIIRVTDKLSFKPFNVTYFRSNARILIKIVGD